MNLLTLKYPSFLPTLTSIFVVGLICSLQTMQAQVKASIDSTSIKIGAQINYTIQVEIDSVNTVEFPSEKTFAPLEVIETFPIDTTKENQKFKLLKKYALTKFDSGSYYIPMQKVTLGTKVYTTDSLLVEIKNIPVDTTKQGLYDVKPIIKVSKKGNNWWKYIFLIIAIISFIAFLLYWFIWRKKPLTEAEEIALLPPYDRAKLALKKLDASNYLQQSELKTYYSELTFIIRKYLDEKVYDRALESTTDELIERLTLLKEGNKIDLSNDDIKNIETILKRADLVKFAKSKPNVELAKIDRNTIDIEIDQVKEALPEPTEEEKLQDQKYLEELEQKQKRKKIILTTLIVLFLLVTTVVGFSLKYGFTFVKDTIIGHDNKELLEGTWVQSEYGFPPISINTPKVLQRVEQKTTQSSSPANTTLFSYGTLANAFSVTVSTTVVPNNNSNTENKLDLEKISEASLKAMENKGATNIVTFRDTFTTANGAEGLKTYGTLNMLNPVTNRTTELNYTILQFISEHVLQQVILSYPVNDTYAEQIIDRIINSIELIKEETANVKKEGK